MHIVTQFVCLWLILWKVFFKSESKLTVLEKDLTNDILNFEENDVKNEGFPDFSFEL